MVCENIATPSSAVLDGGTRVHNWLETRPKSTGEQELFETLNSLGVPSRKFENVDIVAHPDDLVLLGKNRVQIIEYKTVDKTNIKAWKSSVAKQQLKIYCWVLEPLIRRLGYQLVHYHSIIYLTRQGIFVMKATVEKDNYCTERTIKQIFDFWNTGEPLIAPLKWKCKLCPQVFHDKCRLCQGA